MRLVTFWQSGKQRLGMVQGDLVLDVQTAAQALGIPAPADLHELIERGDEGLGAVQTLAARAEAQPELFVPLAGLPLAPCVPRPGKIFCVGLNYRPHAAEAGMAVPSEPVLFSKFANALSGSGQTVTLPAGAVQFDYEAELAIVIGRRVHQVTPGEAQAYIFGYCNANDLSARDLQFRSSQWLLGKSLDGFCPLGPWVATADEVPQPNRLAIRSWVNGEKRQDANTAEMIFDCGYLVSYISRYIPLDPGDIILTGTPEGVVMGYPPEERDQLWLKPGDTVEVEVEGLGRLITHLGAPE